MKRIIVLLLALVSTVFCFAQTITSTTVEVCDIHYKCYGTSSYPIFEGTELGNISALELNGGMSVSGDWSASAAYLHYRIDGGVWKSVILNEKIVISDGSGGDARSPIIHPGDNSIVYEYVLAKTLGDVTTYSRNTDVSVNTSTLINGNTYNLDIVHSVSGTTMPVDTSIADYTATFTKISDISFTDGTSFVPDITPGNTAEIIGQFYLGADVDGATLTAASINLEGTDRSGFSNFKLWASDDNVLDIGTDEYIRTVSADPGSSPLEYASFSVSLTTSGKYIILSADVAEDATGSIRASIADGTALTITDGDINTTISTAYLSSTSIDIPTSVELALFTAETVGGAVRLDWRTESETENSHFLVYRNGDVIARVEGNGTTTEQHSYSYTDTKVLAGSHSYAISDVTYGGVEELHEAVTVEVGAVIEEATFELNKAYPNPFNPRTAISYQLSANSNIELCIFNTSGDLVNTLFSGEQTAGQHMMLWDATDMSSGVYIVRLMAGNAMDSQKVVLMK